MDNGQGDSGEEDIIFGSKGRVDLDADEETNEGGDEDDGEAEGAGDEHPSAVVVLVDGGEGRTGV